MHSRYSHSNIENVQILLSTDSGSTWTTVVDNIPNVNFYEWTVPNTPSTDCMIKIIDIDNPKAWDTSDWVFEIY